MISLDRAMGMIAAQMAQMKLGAFRFSIHTSTYQELSRSTDYTWAAQERFGQHDALQFTGPAEDSITFNGVIFPEFRGGFQQIEMMRDLASTGYPQMLVSGFGKVFGLWVIESITEGQSIFAAAGAPRRQEFTIKIRKYSDELKIPN